MLLAFLFLITLDLEYQNQRWIFEDNKKVKIMKGAVIKFKMEGDNVFTFGCPELENLSGRQIGEGMAIFYGDGWNNYEKYMANMQTGKIRKLSTADGTLLVDDREIDYEAIAKECENGIGNAEAKAIRYGGLGRWDDFEDGLCAISWTLYPDGQYFADEDGFGMKSNREEKVYAIIDTNLDIVEPFRPINDISTYLKELKMKKPFLLDR